MTFHYSSKERYLTDNEYTKLVKDNYFKVISSMIIRVSISIMFLLFLYLIDYFPIESIKLIIIITLSILGLMLPAALSKIFLFALSFFIKSLIAFSIPIFYIIDKTIKSNLTNEAKETLFESIEKEENIELLISFSFIVIAGFLLWFTFHEITDPDYRTISITIISIIYGSGISKYSTSLLEIAGFDLILLKKNKDKDK